MRLAPLFLVLCFSLGCPPAPAGQDAGGGAPDASTGRTVTVTLVNSYVRAAGVVDAVPAYYSDYSMSAHHWELDTLVEQRGTWVDAGVLLIENVPAGTYYLSLSSLQEARYSWLETDRSDIALGSGALGRPDAVVSAADSGTQVHLRFDGLEPWVAGQSELYVASANAGLTGFYVTGYLASPLANGATTVDAGVLWDDALPDATKGDETLVTQTTPFDLLREDGGVIGTVWKVRRAATVSGFTPVAGAANVLAASLSPVPETSTIPYDWYRQEGRAQAVTINPRAVPYVERLYAYTLPYTADIGPYNSFAPLVETYLDVGLNVNVKGSFTVGSPYPAAWPLVMVAHQSFQVPYDVGGGKSATVFAGLFYEDLASRFTATPTHLALSPPRNLKLGSAPILEGLVASSTTPFISWDAPSVGSPKYYIVFDYLLSDGLVPEFAEVTELVTTNTSVRIPPGYLKSGTRHVFVVSARLGASDVTRAPYRNGFPTAYATAASELVTVP